MRGRGKGSKRLQKIDIRGRGAKMTKKMDTIYGCSLLVIGRTFLKGPFEITE